MQQGAELEVAQGCCIQSHAGSDLQGERDHVAAVGAGVCVVGLHHVAEQHRGAAISVGQFERVVDP